MNSRQYNMACNSYKKSRSTWNLIAIAVLIIAGFARAVLMFSFIVFGEDNSPDVQSDTSETISITYI